MPPQPPGDQRNPYSSTTVNPHAPPRRNSRKGPKPWYVLKLSVGVTAAIIAYSSYVYIGRLCIPMIRRERNSLGSRTLGIVFLGVFAVLGMMMMWAYIKVVFTPPGYAKHFSRLDIPDEDLATRENSMSYHDMHPSPLPLTHLPRPPALALPHQISQGSSTRSIPPSSSSLTSPSHLSSSRPTWAGERSRVSSTLHSPSHPTNPSQPRLMLPQQSSESSGRIDTYTALPPPVVERQRSANGSANNGPQSPSQTHGQKKLPTRAITAQTKRHRYCETCGINKPPRTHHCRTCGMCVMRYDHHCPWIGQCVGAQNQKFFFVFVVWAAFFCLWTFSTLVALNVRAATRQGMTVDPEQIATMVLSGLFSLFTVVMFSTHFVLISTNQTTLERLSARDTKEREKGVLNQMHSTCAFGAKRQTRRAWDLEYGRIGREGNMWWLGTIRANWEQVFGSKTWTWLLPIGTTKEQGLVYPRNPRFNADGAWLPRRQWPPELR